MSNAILILGDSGTGKSTSLRNLNPNETFLINVIGKPLPFKGAKKVYTPLSADGLTGNVFMTDNQTHIRRLIKHINDKMPHIKNIILDDFGYTIMNEFRRKALIKGFDKYNELGKEVGDTIDMLKTQREDLFCIVTMHIDTDAQGKTKPKTIGQMIDKAITIEGHFTYIFHTIVGDGQYKFITNNDGCHMAKSSMGLFEDLYIDNDLQAIIEKIKHYENEDINL